MTTYPLLDVNELLRRVADLIPPASRKNVVVIGSIAAAWAFRDVSGMHSVATKDIDLLLHPAIDAVATAEVLGRELLDAGWTPQYPAGLQPGAADTPNDRLPALRLTPPGEAGGWFVELLANPPAYQTGRKHWRRFHTAMGDFGLPSFRYLHLAVHSAKDTEVGLRVAQPACMALAHLLEHAEPDRNPISGLPGNPPRFTKDVGRAIALWWLAREQSPLAGEHWRDTWRAALQAHYPNEREERTAAARVGLTSITDYIRDAHSIALNGLLAPHGTTSEAFRRAYGSLLEWIDGF